MSRARELFDRIRTGGSEEIQQLIRDRKAECLFLDFKQAEKKGDAKSMPDQVRNALSEAIAGFANSEGGVIVWGVDCRQGKDGADLPSLDSQPGIVNVHRFVSWLNGAVSGATLPQHTGVESVALPRNGAEDGFVVTFVDKGTLVPYRQLQGKETNARYPIRAGSSFVAATHDALAGMFGRRPQPKLVLKLLLAPSGDGLNDAATFEVGFMLQNKGPAIARDIFFNANTLSQPGPQCKIEYTTAPDGPFTKVNIALGMFMSTVSAVGERFPPESFTMPATLRFRFKPPFNKPLKLEIVWGCEGAPVSKTVWSREAADLQRIFQELKAMDKGSYGGNQWTDKVRELLAIPDPYPMT